MRFAILDVAFLGVALANNDLIFPCYDEGLDYRAQGGATVCQPLRGRCLKENNNNPAQEKVFGSQDWDPILGEQKCLNNCIIKYSNSGKLTACEWKGKGGNNGCYRTESQSVDHADGNILSTCWIMSQCTMGSTLAVVPDTATPNDCQALCLTKTKCKYWTWRNKNGGICYLKTQDAPLTEMDNGNNDFISGPRECGNVFCNGLGDPHMKIKDGVKTVIFSFYDHAEFIWLSLVGPNPNDPLLVVHNRQKQDLQNKWKQSANTAVAFKGKWTDNKRFEIYGGDTPKMYIDGVLKGSGIGNIRNYVQNNMGWATNFSPSHDGGKWLRFVFDQHQGVADKTFLRIGINTWGLNLHWQMNNAVYVDGDEGLCSKATKKVNWHRQWKLTCNESMLSKQYGQGGCDNDDDEEKDEPDDDCKPATRELAEEHCRECPDQYDPDSCIIDVCQAHNPQDAIDLIPDMCQDDFDDPDCPDGFYMPDWPANKDTMDECVHPWCKITFTPKDGCPICGCKPDGECVAGNEISVGNGDGETPGAMSDCHINAVDDCNCRELCEAEPDHLGYHYLDDVEGQNCCCFTKTI